MLSCLTLRSAHKFCEWLKVKKEQQNKCRSYRTRKNKFLAYKYWFTYWFLQLHTPDILTKKVQPKLSHLQRNSYRPRWKLRLCQRPQPWRVPCIARMRSANSRRCTWEAMPTLTRWRHRLPTTGPVLMMCQVTICRLTVFGQEVEVLDTWQNVYEQTVIIFFEVVLDWLMHKERWVFETTSSDLLTLITSKITRIICMSTQYGWCAHSACIRQHSLY